MLKSWLAGALIFLCGCGGGYRLPKTDGVDPEAQISGSMSLGKARLKPSVCEAIDLAPDYGTLDEKSILEFLKKRGLPVRTVSARSDLVYVEIQLNPERNEWVRLRVAILPDAPKAGLELHRAVVGVGRGSWGIHRANLAVLGPVGSVSNIVAFVAKTKLACWGVLTVDGSDAMVIPGGYREL